MERSARNRRWVPLILLLAWALLQPAEAWSARKKKVAETCPSLRTAQASRLSSLRPDPAWTKRGKKLEGEIEGRGDELLIVATSRDIKKVRLLTAGRRSLEEIRCGIYRLREESYTLKLRARSRRTRAAKEVAVLKVMTPAAVAARLAEVRELVDLDHAWAPAETEQRLEELNAAIGTILDNAYALRMLKVPDWPGLAQDQIAQTLESTLRQVLRQSQASESSLKGLAELYQDLVPAARDFKVVAFQLPCLHARALARNLTAAAEAMPQAPTSESLSRLDELSGRIRRATQTSLCECTMKDPPFPRVAVLKAAGKIFDTAIDYARSDFCDREDEHLARLDDLEELQERMERTCWIEDQAILRGFSKQLGDIRRDVVDSVAIAAGQLPSRAERFKSGQETVRQELHAAAREFKTDGLERLAATLDGLSTQGALVPPISGECVDAGIREIEDRMRELESERLDLARQIEWFRRKASEDWMKEGLLPFCSAIQEAVDLEPWQRSFFCAGSARAIDSLERGECHKLKRAKQYLNCQVQICDGHAERLRLVSRDCQDAYDESQSLELFDQLSRQATCAACDQLQGHWMKLSPGVRTRVAGEYEKSWEQIRQNLWSRDAQRADCVATALDPRSPGDTGDCCGFTADEVQTRVDEIRERCCADVGADLGNSVTTARGQIDRLGRFDQIRWPEVAQQVNSIEGVITGLQQRARIFAPSCPGTAGDLPAQELSLRSSWRDRVFGPDGLYDQLLQLVSGEAAPFAAPQPTVDTVIDWAGKRARDYRGDHRDWHTLLDIQRLVRAVVDECPKQGKRPSEATRNTYNEIKDRKADLASSSLSSDFRNRARQIIMDAENCMAPYIVRTVQIQLDNGGEYRDEISAEKYEILERGRLLELVVKPPRRPSTQDIANLTNLTVEFFALGFSVSPALDDGAEDSSSQRQRSHEGRTGDGFDAYRFREVLSAPQQPNRIYYLVEPDSQASDRKLIVHVVPRSF